MIGIHDSFKIPFKNFSPTFLLNKSRMVSIHDINVKQKKHKVKNQARTQS